MLSLQLKQNKEIDLVRLLKVSIDPSNPTKFFKAMEKLDQARKTFLDNSLESTNLKILTAQLYVSMWKKISAKYFEGVNIVILFADKQIGKSKLHLDRFLYWSRKKFYRPFI